MIRAIGLFLLALLKIAGWTLLLAVLILLVVLLLVLFVPIHYEVLALNEQSADPLEKNPVANLQLRLKVTWLLHLVHVTVSYGPLGLSNKIRIDGVDILKLLAKIAARKKAGRKGKKLKRSKKKRFAKKSQAAASSVTGENSKDKSGAYEKETEGVSVNNASSVENSLSVSDGMENPQTNETQAMQQGELPVETDAAENTPVTENSASEFPSEELREKESLASFIPIQESHADEAPTSQFPTEQNDTSSLLAMKQYHTTASVKSGEEKQKKETKRETDQKEISEQIEIAKENMSDQTETSDVENMSEQKEISDQANISDKIEISDQEQTPEQTEKPDQVNMSEQKETSDQEQTFEQTEIPDQANIPEQIEVSEANMSEQIELFETKVSDKIEIPDQEQIFDQTETSDQANISEQKETSDQEQTSDPIETPDKKKTSKKKKKSDKKKQKQEKRNKKKLQKRSQKRLKAEKPKKKDGFSDGADKAEQGIFRKIRNGYERLRQEYTDEVNRHALGHLWTELLKLLRSYKPKKLQADLSFSLADPSLTGMATGILGMIPLVYRYPCSIQPDFTSEKLYVEGKIQAQGRVMVVICLTGAIRLLRDKEFMYVVRRITKRDRS